jgi:hypothetical protein
MLTKEGRAKLENWAVAGLFAGEGYADELKKQAALYVIDRLIEKKAVDEKTASALTEMGAKLIKGPVGKGVGAAAALGGAGFVGARIGEKKEHAKDEEEVATLAPQIFRAGFLRGAQMGFARAQGELGKK